MCWLYKAATRCLLQMALCAAHMDPYRIAPVRRCVCAHLTVTHMCLPDEVMYAVRSACAYGWATTLGAAGTHVSIVGLGLLLVYWFAMSMVLLNW